MSCVLCRTIGDRSVAPLCLLAVVSLCASGARGALATFDSLSAGGIGETFIDGGIRFFDPDNRIIGSTPLFIINDISAEPPGTLYSPPNVLSETGSGGGPLTRMGEFKAALEDGTHGIMASVDIFYADFSGVAGNTISLEALLDGQVVAADSVVIGDIFQGRARRFTVTGIEFDSIRIIGRGSLQDGVFLGSVDNVFIGVPSPSAACVLLLSVPALVRRRR